MKTKIFIYTICIFVIILIQTSILDYITIYNVKPNLLIVFIVAVALLRGNVEGSVIGFFTGLAQDMVSGKVLGFYALLGLYLGLIIGSVNKRLYRENFLVITFFTFISTVFYEAAVYTIYMWSQYVANRFAEMEMDFVFMLKDRILPEAIYNSVISIIVYIFVIKLNDKFENLNKISRKY